MGSGVVVFCFLTIRMWGGWMLSESLNHITKKSFMEILKLSQGNRERVQPGGETRSFVM